MTATKINNDVLIGTKVIKDLSINSLIAGYLEELTKTGFYGNCSVDVARVLLYDAVLKAVQQQQLPRIALSGPYMPEKAAASS